MLSNILAVAFALASSIVIAWGTVVRHRIALDAHSSIMRTAMGNPLWWVGTLAAVIGYGLQVVALGFGALLIVQPVLVLSLMFTLPLAAWYAGRRMAPFEIFWSLALTVAVAVMVVYGRPTAGIVRPPLNKWLPALAIGIAAMIILAVLARNYRNNAALFLGAVCGGIYGYVALMSKAVVDIFAVNGVVALLTSWELYGLIISAGTGTVVQQYSFHSGPLKHSLPAMTIIEPIVAFFLGYAVLGEKFQVSSLGGWIVMAAALAVMIAGTVILSQQPVGTSPRVAEQKPLTPRL